MSKIVKGKTLDGSTFRPSQWSEMLVHGVDNHDGRICIEVCPVEGKCIRICSSIDNTEEATRILEFAKTNDLTIEEIEDEPTGN